MYKNYYTRSPTITNYPVVAYIEPIANCNLHCPACPTGLMLPDRHSGILTLKKFKELINEFGDYLFNLYMYNWGEPTIHPDFPEMIKYASDKGIKVLSSTNMNVELSDNYAERLVLSGLSGLIVSIDGLSQETYSKYRQGGNLNIVLKNLKKLHEIKARYKLKKPKIIWQFLVFKHNEHEINKLKTVYKILGADSLNISSPLIPKNSKIHPSTNPLYPPQTFSKEKPTKTCSWLYGCFVHNPDDHVSPCCAIPFTKLDYGMYGGNVKEAMNSEMFIKARQFFRKNNRTKYAKNDINGMALDIKSFKSGFVCSQCPTPAIQDNILKDVNLFREYIKNNLSETSLARLIKIYRRVK